MRRSFHRRSRGKGNTTGELERCESNVIRVDHAMAGVGSNSCGPRLAEKYQLEKPFDKRTFFIFR